MISNLLKWLLLLAPLFLNTSYAQPQASHVTLSLKEFEVLFSSAKLKESEKKLENQCERQEKEHALKMKQLEQANKALFPQNFQVLQHTASGVYNDTRDTATFDMELTLRVMESNGWTTIPLIANTTVATNWKIEMLQEDKDNDTSLFVPIDPVTSPDVLLLRQNDRLELATNRHGLFKVGFQSFTRVVTTRNIHQLVMSQFLYPISDYSLSVQGSVRDFSVEPVEAFWRVEPIYAVDGNVTASDIRITLPLTADTISIRWLDDGGAAVVTEPKGADDNPQTAPAELEEATQVTVVHEVMHSINEGMVGSSHIMEFTSSSELGPVDFSLVAGPETRITSIVGHALQNWEVLQTTKKQQLVRLHWKRSHLDSTTSVLLQTETDRAGEERVELPSLVCKDVLRQVGHVGVTKDANVEVHEHATKGGIARCEPSEISSQLRLNMDRPIVLSYKYLNPTNASVVVNVHEHVAMETLEATVDRLHYKAVVTETHTMHSVLVILQSTKLQYLELFGMPESASMYTLAVNSVASKPVQGQNNSILVPLLVGLDSEAANAGRSLLTSVELSYISTHEEPMQAHNGTLNLSPPHLELPISVLTTHIRLPKQFAYNFTGDFGTQPDPDLAVPVPSTYSYQTGKRVVENDYQFGFKDDYWADDEPKEQQPQGVKIVTPNTGRSYYFNRLLVLGTKLELQASYAKPAVVPKKGDILPWWYSLLPRTKYSVQRQNRLG